MRSAASAFPADGADERLLSIWRADQVGCAARGSEGVGRPTGHPSLDAELPMGGWPAAGLIELLLPAPGCGELRLLAPSLTSAAWLLWVAPPFTPYAPALAALGLAPDRLVIASPPDAADAAWTAEQALRSGALTAVLWWQGPTLSGSLPTTLRRLHLAAEAGQTPLFALRPLAARAQSSPAPLRLAIEPAGPCALAIDVFKRRGPPLERPLVLTLPGPAPLRLARRTSDARSKHDRNPHDVVRPTPERVAA
jgi:protein ImuA